jgi:aminocarboxymuconate-semialdehyde decarboxylase
MERVRQVDLDPALRATVAYCAALWRKHDHSHSAGEPIVKIDVHNHVLPKASLELLRSDSRYGATVTETHFSRAKTGAMALNPGFSDPDVKLEQLAKMGLEGAVLSPAQALFFYDLDVELSGKVAEVTNQGMREFAAAHPDRFSWMATVPMTSPERVVPILEAAVEAGAVGVEIGTSIAGHRLDEGQFEPFWAAAERLQTPVMLHPAFNEAHRGLDSFYLQNVIGNPLETTVAIERLIASGVLSRHPRVRVVLVHGGGFFPWQAGRLRHATTVRKELTEAPADPWSFFGQVVVDTLTHDVASLRHLISRVGSANVVMGTDSPFDMATPQPMTMLREAANEATVRAISEENPVRVYRLQEQTAPP